MKEKFIRFMQGRNGMDDLAKAINWVVLGLLVVSLFTKWSILYTIGLLLMGYMYFRVFSRNIPKRYEENQKFRNFRYDAVVKWNKKKAEFAQRKIYRFFSCPMCHQRVRVPKGRGRICITCPKCRTEFVKKS
ncbi:MAG: hypothetical protein IKJ01_09295 [Lachnospiraceae bacterium]|nr:hypothetical protein [Lachnospiraceae bacterium]